MDARKEIRTQQRKITMAISIIGYQLEKSSRNDVHVIVESDSAISMSDAQRMTWDAAAKSVVRRNHIAKAVGSNVRYFIKQNSQKNVGVFAEWEKNGSHRQRQVAEFFCM